MRLKIHSKSTRAFWFAVLVAANSYFPATGKGYTYDTDVSLNGHIISKPGTENFGEPWPKNAHRPKAYPIYILELDQPITVLGNPMDPLSTETEKDVTELQLIDISDGETYDPNAYRRHAEILESRRKSGAPITIIGQLLHAHTVWHIRPVLLQYKDLGK